MNEEMESELTRIYSITYNLAVSEDASVDEVVPIQIKKERNTKAYKETMSKYIEKLTLMKLEKKLIQKNGGQSMRL